MKVRCTSGTLDGQRPEIPNDTQKGTLLHIRKDENGKHCDAWYEFATFTDGGEPELVSIPEPRVVVNPIGSPLHHVGDEAVEIATTGKRRGVPVADWRWDRD